MQRRATVGAVAALVIAALSAACVPVKVEPGPEVVPL